MLAANAWMSALVCGTLRTFLGDFFSSVERNKHNVLARGSDVGSVAHGLSPLVTGFCAKSAHEPLPVGETG